MAIWKFTSLESSDNWHHGKCADVGVTEDGIGVGVERVWEMMSENGNV